jgi:membrane dipeptidase
MSLTRRELINLSALSVISAAIAPAALAAGAANDWYSKAIVIDGLGGPGGSSQNPKVLLNAKDLEFVTQSGMTAINVTVGDVGTMPSLQAFEKIVRDITRWDKAIAENPKVLAKVRQSSDIFSDKQKNLMGMIYGLQDGVSFQDDISRLETLHQLGIRVVQPTYNRRNLLGDGCLVPANGGLSTAGFEAIAAMNTLGILVDLSHCGRRTAMDAITTSSRPVSFTHTGSYALTKHPRHRTDEEMKAVADTGGVIGIYIMPYLAEGKQPTGDDVVRHIEHALNVAGEDHVSIGTDGNLSPVDLTPEFKENFRKQTAERKRKGVAAPFETETGYLFANDLNTARRFETLADMLLERGHSLERVKKIIGGNLARLFTEVWV